MCLVLYVLYAHSDKELSFIVVLFYSRADKHEKVQPIVPVCTACEWQSSDSKPPVLPAGPSPAPSAITSWLLPLCNHNRSSQLFYCPGHTCCQFSGVFLAATASHFFDICIHRCLPLGEIFQQLAINTL